MSELNTTLEELQRTLSLMGFKKTIEALKNARQIHEEKEPVVMFVVQMVCNEYAVNFQQITDNKSTRPSDAVNYARAFIIHYLRKPFEIGWEDLKTLLKRKDQSSLFKWGRLVTDLKPYLAQDKQHCQKKEVFDQKIKKYNKRKTAIA